MSECNIVKYMATWHNSRLEMYLRDEIKERTKEQQSQF